MQNTEAKQHHPPRSTLDMYLDYKNLSARRSKLNTVLATPKLQSMCLETFFQLFKLRKHVFFSTQNDIIIGTFKCPYGSVHYRAVLPNHVYLDTREFLYKNDLARYVPLSRTKKGILRKI
jgi:hypothetical protein